MEILENLKNLLISPRFIAFYWQSGSIIATGLLNLMAENIANIGLPGWAVVFVGLLISQATKAIANYNAGKPMGFAK